MMAVSSTRVLRRRLVLPPGAAAVHAAFALAMHLPAYAQAPRV